MSAASKPPDRFDASGGEAPVIAYDVPLPTSHTGSRLLEIDDVKKNGWLSEATTTVEQIIKQNGLAKATPGEGYKVNIDAAYEYWKEQAMLAGMTSDECENQRAAYEQKAAKKSSSDKKS